MVGVVVNLRGDFVGVSGNLSAISRRGDFEEDCRLSVCEVKTISLIFARARLKVKIEDRFTVDNLVARSLD